MCIPFCTGVSSFISVTVLENGLEQTIVMRRTRGVLRVDKVGVH